MKYSVTSVLAIVALAASGFAASAQPAPQPGKQLSVSYADLDVSSPAGAKILLGRLRIAARNVCGTAPSFNDMKQSQAYETCRNAALDNAVAAVGSPALASLYNGHPEDRFAQR